MRTLLIASVLGAMAVVACSTFGSGDVPEGGDAGSPGVDGSAALLDGSPPPPPDGAVPAVDAGTCDAIAPKGVVYSGAFDGDCDGWSVDQGTIEPVPSPTRCGAGACRVCAQGANEALLQREIPVVKTGGTFELRVQVHGDTFTGSLLGVMNLYDDALTEVGAANNSIPVVKNTWTSGQVIATSSGTTQSVRVRLIEPMSSAGLCWIVDEINLGHY